MNRTRNDAGIGQCIGSGVSNCGNGIGGSNGTNESKAQHFRHEEGKDK